MIDTLGYAASTAVLATFLMRGMLPLRVVAIASNLLFLLYGYLAHVPPVMILHAALLPINIVRLVALYRGRADEYPLLLTSNIASHDVRARWHRSASAAGEVARPSPVPNKFRP
jgi:hypothetical protein